MTAFSNEDVTRTLSTLVREHALLTLVLIPSIDGAAIG